MRKILFSLSIFLVLAISTAQNFKGTAPSPTTSQLPSPQTPQAQAESQQPTGSQQRSTVGFGQQPNGGSAHPSSAPEQYNGGFSGVGNSGATHEHPNSSSSLQSAGHQPGTTTTSLGQQGLPTESGSQPRKP